MSDPRASGATATGTDSIPATTIRFFLSLNNCAYPITGNEDSQSRIMGQGEHSTDAWARWQAVCEEASSIGCSHLPIGRVVTRDSALELSSGSRNRD